ncbi:hypothetical protein Tco_0396973 [Tanacetum coccineum]
MTHLACGITRWLNDNWASALSSFAHQELLKIVKDEIYPIVNQVDARVQNFKIQFLKEATKFVPDCKSLANEADESLAKHMALEFEIKHLLRVVVSQDIMSIVQNPTVVETSDLQTELERIESTAKTGTPQHRSNTKNDKKHKPQVKKPKKVGSKERLASPKPSKPRSCLRWSPTGRIFDLKGKIIASSESESQSDCSKGDDANGSNPHEPIIKRFINSTSFLGRLSEFVYGAPTRVVPSI